MEYNTQRPHLILPEYGRNVQNMIAFAMKLEDREERNKAAQAIIEVMGQLNPHLRDVDDFKHKLWTHLFLMSDFNLDVDSPYVIPTAESINQKPQKMDYPSGKIKYGHYGKYTENILNKIAGQEDEKAKEALKHTMANFMKKQFLSHNNNAVENHVIASQLSDLTNGKLKIENPDSLTQTNQILKTLGISQSNNNKKANKSSGGKNASKQQNRNFKKKY